MNISKDRVSYNFEFIFIFELLKMDFRRESNYRPETNLRGSRSRSPYMASSFGPSAENSRRQLPPYAGAQIGEGLVYNQVRTTSPPKDDVEISNQIEQRHEELKRQIALKEQQLANMTGERDTVDRLKQRLGLQTQGRADAGARFGQGGLTEDSRRGVFPTSVSPNARPVAKMVGLRSTYAHRQGLADSLNDRKDYQGEKQLDEQLQFNPTRQPRAMVTSPLRGSHSRSRSKEAVGRDYTLNTSIASFANHNNQQSQNNLAAASRMNDNYAPYNRDNRVVSPYHSQNRDKNDSPLRQKSPTQDYSNTSSAVIRPQPIENVNSTRAFTAAAHTAGTANQHPGFSYSFTNNVGGTALNPREQLYRDRIEAMRADNESLQRRLNQVSKELERITREKEEINRNLQQTEGDVRHMDNICQAKNDVDAQNQILRDELAMIKETNAGLDSKLKHEEMDTANAGGRVVSTTADKNNLEIDKNNMERDLRDRFGALDELNREKVMVQQKLNFANNELEMTTREQNQLTGDNQGWTEQVQRIQNEKGELLRNLESLTIQYDNTVKNISGDRRNMDRSNDWQTKVLLAKIIFNNLETFQRVRTQRSFTDMVEYSKFDGDCHQKLRSFAKVVYKIGSSKQTNALNRWYINALRPLQTRTQNNDIAMVIDCNKLQAKVFYAWRQYQRDKMDSYHFRTSGVQRLWHLLAKGSKQELKRSMDIWKQKLGFQSHSVNKLQILIKKRNDVNLRQAVYTWRHFSLTLDHACRIRILQIETAQKMYLSQVFQQMRWILRNTKRKRQRMLNQYLKGWQDQVFYNRHLLQTNMAAIAFGQHNQKYLMHNIFNELRHHRERSKYELTSRAVKGEIDVAIADAQAFVKEKQNQVTRKHQNRAGNMIRDAFGKRLHSFFAKWRDHTLSYKQTMNIKVKGRIIHMYYNYMNSYFDAWKANAHVKAGRHRAALGNTMSEQNEKLQNEVLEGEKQLRMQAEADRTSKRRTVDKTFRKLFYRRLSTALGRWRGICHFKQGQEDRAALVIKRMRKRFLKQAFDRYLGFFKTHQQRGRNEASATHIRETLNKRTLRKHFDALCFHHKRNQRSKRYWNKILGKMDKYMKQRAVTIWAENAHLTHALLLESQQHGHTSDIRDATEEIGRHHLTELEQEAALKEHDRKRTAKTHRQIGNYFMRNYTSQTSQMFKTWKQNIQEQVHKEKLLKRTLAHWRKNQLEAVRRVFRKFLSDSRAREHRGKIKQSMIEQEEHRLSIENNESVQQGHREGHAETTAAHLEVTDELSRKILHTMECMERRSQNFLCFSRKRMLFTEWRRIGKKQKAFCYAVRNVLEKSLYKKGLVHLNEQMRDHSYTERVHRITKRFAARFFRVNANDAFTKWKLFGLANVDSQKQATQAAHAAKVKEFDDYHAKVREVNAARCFKFFLGSRTTDIWRAWANVIRMTKLTKAKGVEFAERVSILRRQNAIRRWKGRLMATKGSRHSEGALVRKFQRKYHKAAFFGWKAVHLSTKRLVRALSNFEAKTRHRDYEFSLKCLRGFASTKGAVFDSRKSKGTEDILSLVTQAYLKRLGTEFQRYKAACGGGGQKQSRLKAVFGKLQSVRARDAFQWWRRIHEKAELSQDLHDTGPARAEYWRSMREIENMKDFLREEKYTEDEVEKIYDGVCSRNEGLMRKYILRLKITQQPKKRLLPIVWQRWREFVGIRKLLKYQLKRCQNAIDDRKADMQRAFKKWRNGPDQLAMELWRLPAETLVQLGIRTTKDLDDCGDSIGENSAIQNHLMMQRDEFLNYYIKGQILAMGLLKDRAKFVEMQACSRWLWARRQMTRVDFERQIRDAAYLHANLEQQQISITAENLKYTAENKELHQFGQDGSVIRKNKEKLVAETDKFKARIADTDQDYEELMAQSKLLTQQVQEAEARVAAQSHNRGAFQKQATLKGVSSADGPISVGEAAKQEPETSAEKKQRERFERLAKLSQGAGLR